MSFRPGIVGSGPPSGGTWISPNQYKGRSEATESNHQPDSGTRKISRYSRACPARAPNTCQRGIVAGSRGRASNSRHTRRSTANARMVSPSDLWKLKTGITFGRLGSSTMTRPIAPCTRISATIVQWKNLARLPQWFGPLLSMSGFRLRRRSLNRRGLAAQAFRLDADLHRIADVGQILRHAENRALERRRGGEAGGVAQVVGIEAGTIERHVEVELARDPAQGQRAANNCGSVSGFFRGLRNEMRLGILARFEEFPGTDFRVPGRIAKIQRRGIDDRVDPGRAPVAVIEVEKSAFYPEA